MRRSIHRVASITLATLLAVAAQSRPARAQAHDVYVQLHSPAQGELFTGWCSSTSTHAGGRAADVYQMTDTAGAAPGVMVFALDMSSRCAGRLVQALARHEVLNGSITIWQPNASAPDITYQIAEGTLSRVSITDASGTATGYGLTHVEMVSPSWNASAGSAGNQAAPSGAGSSGSAASSSAAAQPSGTALRVASVGSAVHTPVIARVPLRSLTLAQLPRVVRAQPAYDPAHDARHPEWLPAQPHVGDVVTLVGSTTAFPPEPYGGTFLGLNLGLDVRVPVDASGRAVGPLTIAVAPIRKPTGAATASLQSAAAHHEVLRAATLMWVRLVRSGQYGPSLLIKLQNPVLTGDLVSTGSTNAVETVTLSATGATVWDESSDYTGATTP